MKLLHALYWGLFEPLAEKKKRNQQMRKQPLMNLVKRRLSRELCAVPGAKSLRDLIGTACDTPKRRTRRRKKRVSAGKAN